MRGSNATVPVCLADFLRDVKFLADHSRPKNRRHGQVVLNCLRKLFRANHQRKQYRNLESFQRAS
ncbi:MAG: hypothetical protein KatS3mg109_1998 [Pirellulaceae bacterium]|nr:MAG: hypothetical protein KatS3mg109_1998 [Pirellulaceae bacterium]